LLDGGVELTQDNVAGDWRKNTVKSKVGKPSICLVKDSSEFSFFLNRADVDIASCVIICPESNADTLSASKQFLSSICGVDSAKRFNKLINTISLLDC
ncbi:MAG: hypothetical protein AAGJ70_08645, partial [Pseudomonadota bacterium]